MVCRQVARKFEFLFNTRVRDTVCRKTCIIHYNNESSTVSDRVWPHESRTDRSEPCNRSDYATSRRPIDAVPLPSSKLREVPLPAIGNVQYHCDCVPVIDSMHCNLGVK